MDAELFKAKVLGGSPVHISNLAAGGSSTLCFLGATRKSKREHRRRSDGLFRRSKNVCALDFFPRELGT